MNIDDMNPEFYDYLMQKLFEAGALDVYYTSIQMKKNRPGTKINILTKNDNLDQLVEIMLTETTTLGVRIFDQIERYCLEREYTTVTTPWGEVKMKIGLKGDQVVNIAPEYEDCKEIAVREGIPLKKVYDEAKKRIAESSI